MSFRRGALLASALILCSLPAKADPIDDALDAVRAQINTGDYAGATAGLDRLAVPSAGQLIRARYLRAVIHYRKGEKPKATAELLAFLPAVDNSALRAEFVATGGAHGEKARALFAAIFNETQQFAKLPPLYSAMAQDYPENPEWQYLLADALYNTSRFQEAAAAYSRFAEQHPTYSRNRDAWFRTADALHRAGRPLDAALQYRRAAEKFPNDPHAKDAWFRKPETLRQLGRYEEEYSDLLTVPGGQGPAWEIAATVKRAEILAQYLRRDFDLSNRLCEELVAKYPNHPDARLAQCRLARNYLYDLPAGERDYARARGMLRQIISANPDWNMAFEMKLDVAKSFYFEKDYPNAIAHFQMVLDEYPDNYPNDNWHAHIRYLLGDAYRANKQKDEAFAAWKQVIALYPEDIWAAKAQERLAEGGVQ